MKTPVIYTGLDWREQAGAVHLLWPFWGPDIPWEPRFDELYGQFLEDGRGLFLLTEDKQSADYFLPPCGWQKGGSSQALRMAELARRHGKPLLLFFNSDSDERIPVEGATVFRTSLSRSAKLPWEHAWPAWTCDVHSTYGRGVMHKRPWASRPTVAYCGYIDYRSWVERLQRTFRGQISESMRLRGDAVRNLSRRQEIDCRFVLRRRFGGRATQAQRREFATNLLVADYALVARGKGNFSYRLYEAMSAGSIPVFLDTDCCLPFDDIIPYRELFVWVAASEVARVGDAILEFHARHDTESLFAHRCRIRELFDRYLSPYGFHQTLSERLAKALQAG